MYGKECSTTGVGGQIDGIERRLYKTNMARVCAIALMAGIFAGCGSGSDGPDGLERYAGWYDVTEAFSRDTGNQCPPEPTEMVQNSVEVRIDGNMFEARFSERWSTLLGEIHENASFFSSVNLGPDQILRFEGHFNGDTLVGSLDDVRGASCTRTFSVNGTKRI